MWNLWSCRVYGPVTTYEMRDTTVTILFSTGLVLLAFFLVLRLYPPLGARAAGARLQTVRGSAHYVKN